MPDRIGDYAIKRVLGRGGMGTVYLAVQEHPRRTVALKVMKGGVASDSAMRRFEYEAQILARLRHPNIAQVYEAGTHREGEEDVPYFALEYIPNARPITEYAKIKGLSTRDRLALFSKVCGAVHHGHQKGIIHRDLKPGNILVDSNGEPKIIDFGVARATDSDMVVTTLQTNIGQLIGTLQYMSPEQCEADPHDLDMRSDVYALGVILYELLCEQLPYDVTKAAVYEAARVIHEEPPPRPSTINRTLRGDVETITLKALEKERERRYRSAADLGDDIQRYLNDEPIEARPPSALYHLRKLTVRHKIACLAFLFGALATLVLVAVPIVVSVSIQLARQELADQADAARQAARERVVTLQRAIEVGRIAYAYPQAAALLEQHGGLPEVRLVWAQASARLALKENDAAGLGATTTRLKTWMDADPDLAWAYAALLEEIYTVTGDTRRRANLAAQYAARPKTADAWFLHSFTTLDLKEAAERVQESVSIDPRSYLVRMRGALLFSLLGDTNAAMNAADALVALGTDRYRWVIFKGDVKAQAGEYSDAAEIYTDAIGLEPSNAAAYRARAVARLCQKLYDAAIADCEAAVARSPSRKQWVRYQLATPLWIKGRLTEAADEYRQFRAGLGSASLADIRLVLVLREHARALRSSGDADGAGSCEREADSVLEELASGQLRGSWFDEIRRCIAGQLEPHELVEAADAANEEELCEAYYYAGEAGLLAGRTDEARNWFRKCVSTGLVFDADSSSLDPMNEYHLAVWRLHSLENAGDPANGE